MERIRLRLLGGFEARLAGGGAGVLESRKTEALLAILACRPGEPQPRGRLCGLLWGDRGEQQARHSLNQALSALRRALPLDRPLLLGDREAIAVVPDAIDVDVATFSRLVTAGDRLSLRQAASLYRGPLLDGFELRETGFEEWLTQERARIAERAHAAVLELAEAELAANDEAAAAAALARAIELDPLSEESRRRLIRLYMKQGRYNQAIQQYRACEATLKHGLGVAPEPATSALYVEAMRQRDRSPAITPADGRAPDAASAAGHRVVASILCVAFATRQSQAALDDLEDVPDRLAPLIARMAQIATGHGGTILGRATDGLSVLFGTPAAFEDHAARACQVAVEIADVARIEGAPAHGLSVVVDAGEIVVAIPARPSRESVHGECLRRAEWLAGSGLVDGVGVTGSVVRLADRFWGFGPAAEIRIGPDREPVPLFAPVRRHVGQAAASPFLKRPLSPFVGRQAELEVLSRAADMVSAGRGQIVAAVGEPGVGKSRLFYEFMQSIANDWRILTCGGDPQFAEAADWPIAQLVRECCSIGSDVPQAALGETIAAAVAALSPGLERNLPALMALLGVDPADPAWNPIDARMKRRRIADAVQTLLRRHALVQPLVVAMEDLHWFDAASMQVVDRLVDALAATPMLLIVNYRPEFTHAWAARSSYHQIQVRPLAGWHAERLLDTLLGSDSSVASLRGRLLARTDGNPFFVEECIRALVSSGEVVGDPAHYRIVGGTDRIILPDTVQAVLAARIDGLPATSRDVLQVAAVIGSEVPLHLLAAITGLDDERLHEALSVLQSAEILVDTALHGEPAFRFKHALLQDATYGGLLHRQRRDLHAKVADAMLHSDPDLAATRPELLASHEQRGGRTADAVRHWSMAGDLATRRSAVEEAMAHYRTALALLPQVDEDTARFSQEADLCMKLANAFMQAEGYSSAHSQASYERARTLARRLDDSNLYIAACAGMAPTLFAEARFNDVLAMLGPDAPRLDDVDDEAKVHFAAMRGLANFYLGNFEEARRSLETARRLDDDVQCTHQRPLGGGDPCVIIRRYEYQARLALGNLEHLWSLVENALAIAHARGHAFSVAWAMMVQGVLLVDYARYDEAEQVAMGLEDICVRYGFKARLGNALMLRGVAGLHMGRPNALVDLRNGVDTWATFGGKFHIPIHCATIAHHLIENERVREAEEFLVLGERTQAESEERAAEAELLRLRGRLFARAGDHEGAWQWLRSAFDVAVRQQAKLHQLRAATDLAQLLGAAGDREGAAAMLLPVYDGFKGAGDFPDVTRAMRLLDGLSATSGTP